MNKSCLCLEIVYKIIIMKNIHIALLFLTFFNSLSWSEISKTVSYTTIKKNYSLSLEETKDIHFKVKYNNNIGDWRNVIKTSAVINTMDFYSIEDEDLKKIYVDIMVFKLNAHKERINRDISEFKTTYNYLKEISAIYKPVKLYIASYTKLYNSLVPSKKPWIVPYSSENINNSVNVIKELVDGSGFVTAGRDKTIKFWDNQFKIVKQIHLPSSRDLDGVITALSLHPTKPILACAGYTGLEWDGVSYIYYINYETEEILKRVPIYGDIPTFLEFNRDGQYLVQGNSLQGIFSVYTIEDWSEKRGFLNPGIEGSLGVAISGIEVLDNSFLLLYSNGLLRKYDYYLNLILEKDFYNDGSEYSMDLDKNSVMLALTVSRDKTAIIDSDNFEIVSYLYQSKNIKNIRWDSNGNIYGTGGIYRNLKNSRKRSYGMFKWDGYTKKSYDFIHLGEADSDHFIPLQNGNIAYITSLWTQGLVIDNRANEIRKSDRFIFSSRNDKITFFKPSGVHLAFKDYKGELYEFDLIKRNFGKSERFTGFNPTHKMDNNSITIGNSPTINGNTIKSTSDYSFRYAYSGSLIFKEDRVAWSTPSGISLTNLQGDIIWSNRNKYSICRSIYGSYDGRFIIGAFDDGSLKWYKQSSGELLFTLYIDPVKKAWLIFTPDGYYDTSDINGSGLAAWHVNRGSEELSRSVDLKQFAYINYKPEMINLIINSNKDDPERFHINSSMNTPYFEDFFVNNREIESGISNIELDKDDKKANFRFKIKSPTPSIKGLRLFHNGRKISFQDLISENRVDIEPLGLQWYQVELNIPIVRLKNRYRIFYRDKSGIITKERVVNLNYANLIDTPRSLRSYYNNHFKPKGSSHIFLLGISDYNNAGIRDLKYPRNDIKSLNIFFKNRQKRKSTLYSLSKDILGKRVSRNIIIDSLTSIEKSVKSGDRVLLYLSGNIVKRNSKYYFLTSLSNPESDTSLKQTTITIKEVKDSLDRMYKAQSIILILDSTYRGSISPRELSYIFRDSGISLILPSTGGQESLENIDSYNGLFTTSFIKAFANGDKNGDGFIHLDELDNFLTVDMAKRSNNKQKPWLPNSDNQLDEIYVERSETELAK